MEQTKGHLADGREIVWFDQDGTAREAVADTRTELGPRGVGGVMRRDPLTGEWVALAAHRQARTFMPAASECPLCPSRPGSLSEVPSPDYQVVAFENRFPSFGGAGRAELGSADLYDEQAAVGRCEVLCFSSDHDGSFAQLDQSQARLVVDAWAERTAALNALPEVAHVFPFENRGVEIGVTLQHPHGQIYGYPFVPPHAATELAQARSHFERTGSSLFGDIIAAEQAAGERIVAQNDHWIAFVPYAARWPMEVHFFPLQQRADIAELDAAQRDSFADIYLSVLRAFDRLYDMPMPYIASWQQAPARVDRDVSWVHLELFSIRRSADKLKFLAGSESAQGAFVGDVMPEQQAARLREVLA
ncbi:galactose-1-phosphate uridylyltransferase [Calidifontibacter terrae]